MKKTIYLTISLLIILCFPAETCARSEAYEPRNIIYANEVYSPTPLNLIKAENQQNELACCQTSNVTVLNSKQVKVKYEFWIVKIFKQLFKKD